jgi:hypothetical protein
MIPSFKTVLLNFAPLFGVGIAVEAGMRLERSNTSLFNNSTAMLESLLALGLIFLALLLVAMPVAVTFRDGRH